MKSDSALRPPVAMVLASLLLGGACAGGATDASQDGRGRLVLAFSKVVGGAATSAPTSGPTAGNVALGQISSITVTITAVEALYQPAGADEAEWVSRKLEAPITLNLLALPTDPANPVTATVEALDAGAYFNLRLHVADARIVFAEAIRVGGGPVAKTYPAQVPHPIRIAGEPGGRLLLPTARFEVLDSGATKVDIVFDEGTSVRSVVATPNFLLMAPVLIAGADRPDD